MPLPEDKPNRQRPEPPWAEIDTVLLDLDGTLLDKHFDDYFWEQHLPRVYAEKNRLAPDQARAQLLAVYRSVENTLAWTDLEYWSDRLELDIGAEKRAVSHLVAIHPHVRTFLVFLNDIGKKPYLVTNAHPQALKIKLERVPITHHFGEIICSQDVGLAKEQPEFWTALQRNLPYDPARTLFVDDTERVLQSAAHGGLRHLIHVAKASSRLPARFSTRFPSIASFAELLPGEEIAREA
jgi:5'-nucleotidase